MPFLAYVFSQLFHAKYLKLAPFGTVPRPIRGCPKKFTGNEIAVVRITKDWQQLAKQIGGAEKTIFEPLKVMAETLPQIATVQAGKMMDQYGQNDIYPAIIEQIIQRAAATLLCLTNS